MDNLPAHKVAGVKDAIEQSGASLFNLPPYSPDFNPICRCLLRSTTTPTPTQGPAKSDINDFTVISSLHPALHPQYACDRGDDDDDKESKEQKGKGQSQRDYGRIDDDQKEAHPKAAQIFQMN